VDGAGTQTNNITTTHITHTATTMAQRAKAEYFTPTHIQGQ